MTPVHSGACSARGPPGLFPLDSGQKYIAFTEKQQRTRHHNLKNNKMDTRVESWAKSGRTRAFYGSTNFM